MGTGLDEILDCPVSDDFHAQVKGIETSVVGWEKISLSVMSDSTRPYLRSGIASVQGLRPRQYIQLS